MAAERETERASWSSNNVAGAFASPLKLTVAGQRHTDERAVHSEGYNGFYWSSTLTVGGGRARMLHIEERRFFPGMGTKTRTEGFSVRCIKD